MAVNQPLQPAFRIGARLGGIEVKPGQCLHGCAVLEGIDDEWAAVLADAVHSYPTASNRR